MMTIVTTVTLKQDGVAQWDRAMHARVRAAQDQPGWVGVQLLRPSDNPLQRAIIGTWQTREDWASWHDDETFRETREHLAGLEDGPAQTTWYDVVEAP